MHRNISERWLLRFDSGAIGFKDLEGSLDGVVSVQEAQTHYDAESGIGAIIMDEAVIAKVLPIVISSQRLSYRFILERDRAGGSAHTDE